MRCKYEASVFDKRPISIVTTVVVEFEDMRGGSALESRGLRSRCEPLSLTIERRGPIA